MRKLDKSKPYAEVWGASNHRYEQGGVKFAANGEEVIPLPVIDLPLNLSKPWGRFEQMLNWPVIDRSAEPETAAAAVETSLFDDQTKAVKGKGKK